MIEAKGDITINQYEDGDNLRTIIHVDVEHSGHHDLLVDQLIKQVAVVIKTLDAKPCLHIFAYAPDDRAHGLDEDAPPRKRYCILCGKVPKPEYNGPRWEVPTTDVQAKDDDV